MQGSPVLDAVALDAQEVDVRRRAEKALLEVLAESVVDGERDDERGDAGGDTEDGDAGDDADEGLTTFGAQVSGCDEEFEAHGELSAIGSQFSVRAVGTCARSWPRRIIDGGVVRQALTISRASLRIGAFDRKVR